MTKDNKFHIANKMRETYMDICIKVGCSGCNKLYNYCNFESQYLPTEYMPGRHTNSMTEYMPDGRQ